jgi:hypothetical protein
LSRANRLPRAVFPDDVSPFSSLPGVGAAGRPGCADHRYRIRTKMSTKAYSDEGTSRLSRPTSTPAPASHLALKTDIVVIGAGQAGLSSAYTSRSAGWRQAESSLCWISRHGRVVPCSSAGLGWDLGSSSKPVCPAPTSPSGACPRVPGAGRPRRGHRPSRRRSVAGRSRASGPGRPGRAASAAR